MPLANLVCHFCRDYVWVRFLGAVREDANPINKMLTVITYHTNMFKSSLFQVMDETKTQIAWPSKLKIGAKSKKGRN